MFSSSDFCALRDFLAKKKKPSPINARPTTPPTTPPAIAPTRTDSFFTEVREVPDESVDDAVVDCAVVEIAVPLVCERLEVETVDELAVPTEEASLQTSLLPGPPSMHLFVQNLTTDMSPLYPPSQWKSVLVDTPLLLASKDAF